MVDGRVRLAAMAVGGGLTAALIASLAGSAAAPVRAVAAVGLVFVAAACIGGAVESPPGRRERFLRAGALAGAVVVCGAVATLVAGRDPSVLAGLGAVLVPAGAFLVAHGAAVVARRLGISRGGSVGVGAALPIVLLGWLFVADPWVEWDRDAEAIQRRAEVSLAVSPLASIGALQGGLGVDWQRARWLYDGPAPGVPGLSVVGQYYPSRPTSPLVWSAVAGAAGLLLLLLGGDQVAETHPPTG